MYTVNVRKPDVRFGEPDEKTSGFRIVRLSDVRFTVNRPDFECPNRLRELEFKLPNVRNPDKLSGFQTFWNQNWYQNRFQTGLEPV